MTQDNADSISTILNEVLNELDNAITMHKNWPEDPFHAVAILNEEVGELNQAVLQSTYQGAHKDNIRQEAIQSAAMAIRFIYNLDNYCYDQSLSVRDL